MATSSAFPSPINFPFFLLFLALTPLLAFASFPSSSVASTQLDFWSKNVLNNMPQSLVSKLSSLSLQEADSLASLVSEKSISPNANFCSRARLFCKSKLEHPLSLPDNHYAANQYNHNYGALGTSDAAENADPNSFFRVSVLQKGNNVHLPNLNDQLPPRSFLPSRIASQISTISSTDLEKLFPQSFASPGMKEAIETSISYCEAPELKGEIKSCPNSIEGLIEFSKKALGAKQLISLTSQSTKGSLQKLKIGSIKQLQAEKVVSCHEVFYPFAAYYCHVLSSTHLYTVDLIDPATKAPVNRILAICHMDTSQWSPEHVAFKILKFSPGQGEACHWFSHIDLAWMGKEENKA